MDVFNWLTVGSFGRTFQFLEKKKPHRARSGECRMGLSVGLCFLAKNWWTKISLCASALSWCKIQPWLYKSGLLFWILPCNFVKTSFWCLNNNLFSEEPSSFPHFHQFSSLLDCHVICHLPHPLFPLKICAIQTL